MNFSTRRTLCFGTLASLISGEQWKGNLGCSVNSFLGKGDITLKSVMFNGSIACKPQYPAL